MPERHSRPMRSRSMNKKDFFKLKALRPAKVSEISEATAAAPVGADEKVNFHIGNPVQDERLDNCFFELLNDETGSASGRGTNDDEKCSLDSQLHEFLRDTLKRCVAYTARGGYHVRNPNRLIGLVADWLSKDQQEPLEYNAGIEKGQREIIFASGGRLEALRVLFKALGSYLEHLPAKMLFYDLDLPVYLQSFKSIHCLPVNVPEAELAETVEATLKEENQCPAFLLLGSIPDETRRRQLRQLCLHYPLMIIELNDAPNHWSLAREAQMKNCVIRILTPAAIHADWTSLSTTIIAGNADFLRIFESQHFELKGTPAAAEMALLEYLFDNQNVTNDERYDDDSFDLPPGNPLTDRFSGHTGLSETMTRRIEKRIQKSAVFTERALSRFAARNRHLSAKYAANNLRDDTFASMTTRELTKLFFEGYASAAFASELTQNFLNNFVRHHPQYDPECTFAVSGSTRTAMSLINDYCGISEVVTVDLSWNYEHCFDTVHCVALNEDLSIDSDGLKTRIKNLIEKNPDWRKKGAVVLNNPHNATSRTFDEDDLRDLLAALLDAGVWVVDDLSYRDLAAADSPVKIKTLKQMVVELVRQGMLSHEAGQYLITIHSLSKTDCFAGARVAVTEISHPQLQHRFAEALALVKPNVTALLLSYLFYRNAPEKVNYFYHLRNRILSERMRAIEASCAQLPAQRNPYGLKINKAPASMYPRLVIENLPDGLSLDWLSSKLALQGIGLLPLTTFARTGPGFERARKTFRLTLGGTAFAGELRKKTRRILIDLNRLIDEQALNYTPKHLNILPAKQLPASRFTKGRQFWWESEAALKHHARQLLKNRRHQFPNGEDNHDFFESHLPQRLACFHERFETRLQLSEQIITNIRGDGPDLFEKWQEDEFYKDNLQDRAKRFQQRISDRTVHPTQMYALEADLLFDRIFENYITNNHEPGASAYHLARSLVDEYAGKNVTIDSALEADELVCDLKSMLWTEMFCRLNTTEQIDSFLSFWGDWDGSTRPSGQGHRLVSAPLIENIRQMSLLLELLLNGSQPLPDDMAGLLSEVRHFRKRLMKFRQLLNRITALTHQLEKRYRSVLPMEVAAGRMRQLTVKMHLARDPLNVLWEHNDRLERQMRDLRSERRDRLDYYFSLNKRLRKAINALLGSAQLDRRDPRVMLPVYLFHDLLKRFVITPRIHQKIITADDPFAIDTTIENIVEINAIGARYGNPGAVLALQISMSDTPEALIRTRRKISAANNEVLRNEPGLQLPDLWLIPLFEDEDAVANPDNYLNRIWDFATHNRKINQTVAGHFTAMICEVFIAGSDLSQQVGQPAAAALYRKAKFKTVRWLAGKGLMDKVRIKLGSGEPMQRQGGYYAGDSGAPAFITSKQPYKKLKTQLAPSALSAVKYARSPLAGLLYGADLRTYQSAVAEQLRMLPVKERVQLLVHVKQKQAKHQADLIRAGEPLLETRLRYERQGVKQLERLTRETDDPMYLDFCKVATKHFRQVTYGKDEDVVGIHVISYFISRSIPPLRDRPTVRPVKEMKAGADREVIDRIAGTLPLSRHGSMLRAIGHNRAQTMVLGINQLTSGLFRALNEFVESRPNQSEAIMLLENRILPRLPVKEMLHSLRIYQDRSLTWLNKMEQAFPAGNNSISALQEENELIDTFVPLMQKELLRRQGINVGQFYDGDHLKPAVLNALRPDLAVLLQNDLFNTDMAAVVAEYNDRGDQDCQREMRALLHVPLQIHHWRKKIWTLIAEPVFQQVSSFVQLAQAVFALTKGAAPEQIPFSSEPAKVGRMRTSIANALKGTTDDSMRRFLYTAVEYLSGLPESGREIPIDILRALRDVEQILRIDQQVLNPAQQQVMRYYHLQMARVCGENG